jgi:hypothetical protein
MPDVPTVAISVLLLLHVPPVGVELNNVESPKQMFAEPVIAVGNGSTVTIVVIKQPVGNVYVTFTVPGVAPKSSPVVGTTAAVPVPGVTLHSPPDGVLLSVMLEPEQTAPLPATIAEGNGLTVTTAVA